MLRVSVLVAALICASPAQAETLKIFAAASLSDALDEALAVCDPAAVGVYAGSGTIARQIAQGAPASIYISANPQWMDWLQDRELVAADTRVDLLGNRLVWIGLKSEPKQEFSLDRGELVDAMRDRKVAVADTDTVPAGIYARQAFEAMKYWDAPRFREALVQSSNVREALTWVLRGEAGLGVVYLTDALGQPVLDHQLIPDAIHDPIRYPAAVTTDRDTPNARGLLACLQGEEASGVFDAHGFQRPN